MTRKSSPFRIVALIVAILMSSMITRTRAWSSKVYLVSARHRQRSLNHARSHLLMFAPLTTLHSAAKQSASLQKLYPSSSSAVSFSTFRNSYRKTSKKNTLISLDSAAYDDDDDDDANHDVRHSPLDVDFTPTATTNDFRSGDKIQVEVISFGPLGASVDVIARGHAENDLIDDAQPPLAKGLILQREIAYFRELRNHVDVVRGEVLPAFVEAVRDDGKLDIGLRAYGGKAKAEEVSKMILDRLAETSSGTLPIGDKSLPEEIAQELPGVSKVSFKKAVSFLYKQGLVQPGPDSIALLKQEATVVPTTKTATKVRSPPAQKEEQQLTKVKTEPRRLPFGIKGGSKQRQGDGNKPKSKNGPTSSTSSAPRRESGPPSAN